MDSTFRPLDDRERAILEKLLEPEFRGRDELRLQLDSVTARQLHEDGTLKLRCDPGSPSPGKYNVPMEATWRDTDGGEGCVMLHLKDGINILD
jgi:hypothetical protein